MCVDKQKKEPFVSVIMPSYNMEKYIEEAITSVINQTFVDWELLVVDDCSTDGTREIILKFAENDSRIKMIVNEVNMGVAKTRNHGIDCCNGKYVAFLDSDDYWHSRFLEKMVACAENKKADIVYCSYELVDEQKNKICNDFIVPEDTTFEKSIVRSVITCSTVLMTSETVKSNHFPTNMYHEDIALWFQLLRDGKIAKGVIDVLAAYRQRANSRSSDKIKGAARRWVVYRKHLKMPFFKSVITMFKYAYYGTKKFKRI